MHMPYDAHKDETLKVLTCDPNAMPIKRNATAARDSQRVMSQAASISGSEAFVKNPYESHPSLTATEAEVLWEYAKLAQHVKKATLMAQKLSETPDKTLLARLRVLEKKMGLVLTLFKASVWGVINEQSVVEPVHSGSEDTTIRH